jgi:hypothetical protein
MEEPMSETRGYKQWTITDGRKTYADLPAPSAVDALARFAMREYADPREVAKDATPQERAEYADPFFIHDGALWMVYENLQLTAI